MNSEASMVVSGLPATGSLIARSMWQDHTKLNVQIKKKRN